MYAITTHTRHATCPFCDTRTCPTCHGCHGCKPYWRCRCAEHEADEVVREARAEYPEVPCGACGQLAPEVFLADGVCPDCLTVACPVEPIW